MTKRAVIILRSISVGESNRGCPCKQQKNLWGGYFRVPYREKTSIPFGKTTQSPNLNKIRARSPYYYYYYYYYYYCCCCCYYCYYCYYYYYYSLQLSSVLLGNVYCVSATPRSLERQHFPHQVSSSKDGR